MVIRKDIASHRKDLKTKEMEETKEDEERRATYEEKMIKIEDMRAASEEFLKRLV